MPFPNFKNDIFFPADFSSALSTLQATSRLSSLSSLLGPKVNSTLCLCTELTQHTACLIKCPVATRLPTRSTVHPVVCPLVVSPKLLTGESFAFTLRWCVCLSDLMKTRNAQPDNRVGLACALVCALLLTATLLRCVSSRRWCELVMRYAIPPPPPHAHTHTHTHIIACLVNYMWLVSVD